MGIIYKAVNQATGSAYIGQTMCTLEKRWNEHIRASRTSEQDYKFHRAIRKYGAESFDLSVVEEVPDDELDTREIYWIDFFDTYHNGYNSTTGGGGSQKADYGLIRSLWEDGFSAKEIANMTGYCSTTVLSAVHTCKNFSNYDAVKRGKKNQSKRVTQYDLAGNFIRTFDSTADAAEHCRIDRSLVSICCRKIRPTGGGYQWRYEHDIPPTEYKDSKCRNVQKFTKDGELVGEYASITEAAQANGISNAAISKACSIGRLSFGHMWKYAS